MRNIASIIAPAALAAGLVGCAVTAADGRRLALGSDEFRAYAEEVFREQNRVATDLAFALEDADAGGAVPAALAGAEDALLEACARLNDLATLRRDGENVGARRGARNARSVPGCEAATRAAQGALDDAK